MDLCTSLDGLPTDPVSFRTDVIPAFENSCSLSNSCHGGDKPRAGLFLGLTTMMKRDGEMLTEPQIIGIRMGLLSMSQTVSTVPRIVPDEPEASFLVQKMMGTQNDQGYTCMLQGGAPPGSPPCGTEMVFGGALCKSVPERFVAIVSWIDQGALDN